jgi:hypothetical protein
MCFRLDVMGRGYGLRSGPVIPITFCIYYSNLYPIDIDWCCLRLRIINTAYIERVCELRHVDKVHGVVKAPTNQKGA